MKTVKFKSDVAYKIASDINVSFSRFQATLVKEDHDFESIVSDVDNCPEIKVYDESGAVIGTYQGYLSRLAISQYDIEIGGVPTTVVSVELINNDVQAQIDAIGQQIRDINSTQASQSSAIADLGTTVSAISDTQDVQSGAIDDIGTAVYDISDSQAVQNLAIEDLAEAVDELSNQ